MFRKIIAAATIAAGLAAGSAGIASATTPAQPARNIADPGGTILLGASEGALIGGVVGTGGAFVVCFVAVPACPLLIPGGMIGGALVGGALGAAAGAAAAPAIP